MTTLGGITTLARRAQKLAAEQAATPQDLLAQAVKDRRFPAKRFRIEDSPAGTSRLLTENAGVSARQKYGGRLVELIDKIAYFKALADTLPTCKRAGCPGVAGQPCMRGKRTIAPHRNRLGRPDASAAMTEGAAQLEACPRCQAAAGIPCTTPAGRGRLPHRDRRAVADQAGGSP